MWVCIWIRFINIRELNCSLLDSNLGTPLLIDASFLQTTISYGILDVSCAKIKKLCAQDSFSTQSSTHLASMSIPMIHTLAFSRCQDIWGCKLAPWRFVQRETPTWGKSFIHTSPLQLLWPFFALLITLVCCGMSLGLSRMERFQSHGGSTVVWVSNSSLGRNCQLQQQHQCKIISSMM